MPYNGVLQQSLGIGGGGLARRAGALVSAFAAEAHDDLTHGLTGRGMPSRTVTVPALRGLSSTDQQGRRQSSELAGALGYRTAGRAARAVSGRV